jgi:hypothetical protein
LWQQFRYPKAGFKIRHAETALYPRLFQNLVGFGTTSPKILSETGTEIQERRAGLPGF